LIKTAKATLQILHVLIEVLYQNMGNNSCQGYSIALLDDKSGPHPAMRFALLGSGSEGNALVVEVGQSRVLMDCGFSLTETVARLSRIGLGQSSCTAIVVTHEHGDHIGGVARLARKFCASCFSYSRHVAFAKYCVFCQFACK
jgi:glyoxylase-like metal-dependent hydrolase (beta-lactamase superfamily II)